MLLDRFLHRQATLEVIADAIDHAGLTVGKVDELIARGPGNDGPQERRVFCPTFVEPIGLKERVHFSGRKVLEGAVVFQETRAVSTEVNLTVGPMRTGSSTGNRSRPDS